MAKKVVATLQKGGGKEHTKVIKMVKSEKTNSYTFKEEMICDGIENCLQYLDNFDGKKSNNPFAYYTAAVTNSFVRVINIEKRNQNIRDDILEMNNMNPSYTRQHSGEWEAQQKREMEKTSK